LESGANTGITRQQSLKISQPKALFISKNHHIFYTPV
jgi:hypothetical protein